MASAETSDSLRGAAPAYSVEQLRAHPEHVLEYLAPPPAAVVERSARMDTDLLLLPLLPHEPHAHVRRGALPGVLEHARERNEQALAELQRAEGALRGALVDTLEMNAPGAADLGDADLTEVLDQFTHAAAQAHAGASHGRTRRSAEHAARSAALPPAPQDAVLRQLRAARKYTRPLADAEAARSSLSGVELLARLCEIADELRAWTATDADAMLARALSSLETERDALFAELVQQHTSSLKDALRSVEWPHPRFQNPDYRAKDEDPSESLGRLVASEHVRHAWASLCDVQLRAAELGMRRMPSLARRVAGVSTSGEQAPPPVPGSDAYEPLLAVQVLLEPVLLRFRFYFDGTRETNRLDKPEWYLRNMLALIQMNSELFVPAPDLWSDGGVVSTLTQQRADGQRRHLALDTPAELLHTMLVLLRRKVHASMDMLVEQPALLAHTIVQCMTFDTDLRAVYEPSCGTAGNPQGAVRIADEILGNHAYFQRWLDGERAFAQSRYDECAESNGAWSLIQADTLTEAGDPLLGTGGEEEQDAAGADNVTTRLAATLTGILLGVTERYQPLHALDQRAAFVIKVQRPLLYQFHQRLVRHMDAFENMSTAFTRAIPGEISSLSSSSSTDMVRGVNGINRVAKALLSSEYLRKQLEEWSESSFFLSMAQEFGAQDSNAELGRLLRPDHDPGNIDSANLMAILQRGIQTGASAAKTLRPLAKGPAEPQHTSPHAPGKGSLAPAASDPEYPGIWDEFIRKFAEVSQRSRRAIERLVVSEVLEQLRPYIMRRWDQADASPSPGPGSDDSAEGAQPRDSIPTKELVPALARLTNLLNQLINVLPADLLLPVYRYVSTSLSHGLLERILMPNARVPLRFAPDQATRFAQDVDQGWMHVVQEVSQHPTIAARRARNEPTGLGRKPETPWRELLDTAKKLTS